MHIEFLLEEPSTEAVLQVLIPKMMQGDVSFACHVMAGKKNTAKGVADPATGLYELVAIKLANCCVGRSRRRRLQTFKS